MVEPDERLVLGLLLDFEYLLAEMYSRAKTGNGLSPAIRDVSAGQVRGGRAVRFANPIVTAFVKEAARDTLSHIAVLRQFLSDVGERPYAASSIDLTASFTAMAQSAALLEAGESFDAFANETNLILAAYMLEDVGMTLCAHALGPASIKWSRDILVGIYGSLTSRSAIVRTILFAADQANATNAVSVCRQKACSLFATAFQGNDHGVGDTGSPSMMPVDGRGLAWSRTPQQCAAILAGSEEGSSPAFFPLGINAMRADSPRRVSLAPMHFSELASGTIEEGVRQIASFNSEDVELPALSLDIERFQICENVSHQPWTQTAYSSCAPGCIEITNAIVHGAVGIVGVGKHVIAESLWHTNERRHRQGRDAGSAVLDLGMVEDLDGVTVSILAGAAESYWHALIDAVARLVLVPDDIWPKIDRLVYPSVGIRIAEMLDLFVLPPHVEVREVRPYESFRVSTLIQPSSLHGLFDYNPTLLAAAFSRMKASVDLNVDTPRRIFIDRRGSPLRKLTNEDELIAGLPDFTPVRLETLSVTEQIRLFANAEVIVAPHGAGLTNIGFCDTGTVLIEMMMDAYCNWCYRRLAAIKKVRYHCVLGRCHNLGEPGAIHFTSWTVDQRDLLQEVKRVRDHSLVTK